MKDILLHTPEGVRDIYGVEYQKKEYVETKIKEKMQHYGFHHLETPTFEYFDVFSKERGTVPTRDMYKFVDREGETLVLRPDITPQIARCVAGYYRDEVLPLRFSYNGNTYTNKSGYGGKLKETTQIGAELINDKGVLADAEMAALMVDCLKSVGLENFIIDVGQADFFKAITEEAGFDEEVTEELRGLIVTKNYFAVEQLLDSMNISMGLKNIFKKLSDQVGGIEDLEEVKKLTKNERALKAIDNLENFYKILCEYKMEKYISFDLGMLNRLDYYTGVIFQAYTYKTGDVVAAGGRYDSLLGQFGKEAPAIGIAVYVDQLISAMSRQNIFNIDTNDALLLLYTGKAEDGAIRCASTLRNKGIKVLIVKMAENGKAADYEEYAERSFANRILTVYSEDKLMLYTLADKNEKKVLLEEVK